MANALNLVEGTDYVHVCVGERGFSAMLDSLAGDNNTLVQCDIGASAITASSEREDRGITFSRTIYRSALAIMYYAPLHDRGSWAFFGPLHLNVWMALLVTIFITPFFVFFFESIFSNRNVYIDKQGNLSILVGLKEAMWHSIAHTLSIDVFQVNAFSSRLVTVAYAFLVMILANTYTANLAAFLTVQQLDTTINAVTDLSGRAVATTDTYVDRLRLNHNIIGTTTDSALSPPCLCLVSPSYNSEPNPDACAGCAWLECPRSCSLQSSSSCVNKTGGDVMQTVTTA